MAKRKAIKQEEEESIERSLDHLVPDGETIVVDYAANVDRPWPILDSFDVVVVRMLNTGYSLGAMLARARESLHSDGLLLIDYFGYSMDLDNFMNVAEFTGLIFVEHDEKNAALVYKKASIAIEEVGVKEEMEQVED